MSTERFDKLYHQRLNKNILEDYDKEKAKLLEIERFTSKILLSKNLNILIGSGCSSTAIDLMGKTFSNIKNQLDEKTLGIYKTSNDIEGYLNWLISAINFHTGTADKEKYKESFNTTISALIDSMPNYSEYYDNDNENIVETLQNYQLFYNSIFAIRDNSPIPLSPINIFTTNYDLFNEYALDSTNVHYCLGFQGGMRKKFNPSMFNLRYVDTENRFKKKWNPIRKFAKIYKLHGSTNWVNDGEKVYLTEGQGANNDQVMIYPSYIKHDVTNQTPYSELFREFTLSLQNPNSVLIVFGFGFPDEHINQLIEQALNNEDFILVIFGDYDEEKIKSFYDKNSMKSNIHLIGGQYKDSDLGKLHYFRNVINEFLVTKDTVVSEDGDSDE